MHLLQILATHGGTATRAQLAAVSDRHLGAAVRAGLVVRTARGRYADPRAAPELLAASALDAVGLPGERGLAVAPRGRSGSRSDQPDGALRAQPGQDPPPRPTGGRLLVRWTDLEPDEVVGRVTTPLRTALDCATSLPFPRALAVVDAALRGAFVSHDALVVAAARWCGARRPAVVRVVLAGDGRAANTFESVLRGIVLEAGIGGFEPQVVVEDAGPRKRVDLADRRRRIVIEADSFTWHGGCSALSRDAARYDELAAGGWLVLRFAWEHVMGRPPGWPARCARRARCVTRADPTSPRPCPVHLRPPRCDSRRAATDVHARALVRRVARSAPGAHVRDHAGGGQGVAAHGRR